MCYKTRILSTDLLLYHIGLIYIQHFSVIKPQLLQVCYHFYVIYILSGFDVIYLQICVEIWAIWIYVCCGRNLVAMYTNKYEWRLAWEAWVIRLKRSRQKNDYFKRSWERILTIWYVIQTRGYTLCIAGITRRTWVVAQNWYTIISTQSEYCSWYANKSCRGTRWADVSRRTLLTNGVEVQRPTCKHGGNIATACRRYTNLIQRTVSWDWEYPCSCATCGTWLSAWVSQQSVSS